MIAHINAGIPITRDVTLSAAQTIVTTVAKMMLDAGRKRRSTFWTCVSFEVQSIKLQKCMYYICSLILGFQNNDIRQSVFALGYEN